ncbi:MAG: glycosyl hydrolase [Limnochordia bacterium]|nr:MAG: hypothetical protein AA931_04920 [Peptococcaceae bacterium 1109]
MVERTVHGVPLSKEAFRVPPRELGIMPFWFWNGELDYEEMEYQLRELHSKGIPGIFIHSRFGLEVPYLSDEWFKRVQFTIDKAKELGMQVWIYDEKNWPSGTVGWEIPTKHPDLQQRYLELVILDFNGPFFTYLEGTDSRYLDLEDSEPICAYGVRAEEFEAGEIKEIIDVTPNLSFDKVIPWEAPAGRWKLLYFVERRAKWYIDALNPESTKKFIEYTHEQYKKWIGHEFGKGMPGFYTDEPAMHYFSVQEDNYIIPWSKHMFKIFREANGYDLKPYLPALFAGMGDMTTKVRCDFWQALSRQYAKAYYRQISEWCKENNLYHTGHLLYEEFLRLITRVEGNIFDQLKEMHITGVDHLYPRIGSADRPEEHTAMKVGSSAAHHFGSTRLLCESLGGTYWDCTMERMKWIADWEYVLGVNLFNPHGFHYSVEGERKRDWPPSQFYHHPWWEKYDLFNGYVARNSYMLSGGRHVAKVAVLYPIVSIWANYTPQAPTPTAALIEQEFYNLTDSLLRLHFDYDYVDEEVLAGAEVRDGKMIIGDEEYELLILPPLTTIRESTLEKLETFFQAGGKIIADALLPTENTAGFSKELTEAISGLFGQDALAVRADALKEGGEQSVTANSNASGGKCIFVSKGFGPSLPGSTLDKVIRECITPDVEISDPNVFYLHRIKDGKDVYFLVNPTAEDRSMTLSLEGLGRPEAWCSVSGKITPVPVYRHEEGRTIFPVELSQYGSAMFVLNKGEAADHVIDTNLSVDGVGEGTVQAYSRTPGRGFVKVKSGDRVEVLEVTVPEPLDAMVLDGTWQFAAPYDNAFLIQRFRFKQDDEGQGVELGYADPEFDDSEWLEFKQGAWELQLPFERDERTYPVTIWYRMQFESEHVPEDLRLLIDGMKAESRSFFINGEELKAEPRRCKFDAQIKEVDIAPLVKEGTNTIAIRMEVADKVAGLLDLVKLVGSFAVEERNGVEVMVAPKAELAIGSWTDQGYPYYAGVGVLTTTVTIPEAFQGKRVFLELECGDDVVDVAVNGEEVGTILWHPYRIEITSFLKPGEHTIQVSVTNTLINFFEGVKRPGGLLQAPVLKPYHAWELTY